MYDDTYVESPNSGGHLSVLGMSISGTSDAFRFHVEVSRLGAITTSVTTSGLKGMTPVFLNAKRIFSFVNVHTCAFA